MFSKTSLKKIKQKRDQNNFCIATKTLLQNKYLLLLPSTESEDKNADNPKSLNEKFCNCCFVHSVLCISKVYIIQCTFHCSKDQDDERVK